MNSAVEKLRTCSLEMLRDRQVVCDLVCEAGLYPKVDSKKTCNSHKPFCDQGLRIWQIPEQFADYLVYASTLGIKRYLEIGLAAGGSFIFSTEYLKRFSDDFHAWGMDPYQYPKLQRFVSSVEHYFQISSNVTFIKDHSYHIGRHLPATQFDLVFVDGDHSFRAVRRDFETFRDRSHTIAFHDILTCKGVMTLWHLLRQEPGWEFKEFTRLPADFYNPDEAWELYGIGLMKKL